MSSLASTRVNEEVRDLNFYSAWNKGKWKVMKKKEQRRQKLMNDYQQQNLEHLEENYKRRPLFH